MQEQPIPKYIHYCWFGKKPMPSEYKKYMKTWKKYCPNYKIIKWDESNFPIDDFKYASEAYTEKKMAFVSDVARIYALEKYGGIYLDADVEIVKPIDTILEGHAAVLGWESIEANTMGTGFMAFSKGHFICNKMLEYYKAHSFKSDNGELNIKSNTKILAELIEDELGIYPSTEIQNKDDMIFLPRRYFTAFDTVTKQSEITNETYCVHHFAASWFTPWKKLKRKVKIYLNRVLKPLGKKI